MRKPDDGGKTVRRTFDHRFTGRHFLIRAFRSSLQVSKLKTWKPDGRFEPELPEERMGHD